MNIFRDYLSISIFLVVLLVVSSCNLVFLPNTESVDFSTLFSDTGQTLNNLRRTTISVEDVNNDSHHDFFLSGSNSTNETVAKLYINDGFGVFSESGSTFAGVENGSSSFADVDGDDFADLIVTGFDGTSDSVTLYMNANGTFSASSQTFTDVKNSRSDFADIESTDSDQDLIISGYDSGAPQYLTTIYTNDGTGTFASKTSSLPGVMSGTTLFGDFNNDGSMDILITGNPGTSSYIGEVYINDGSGNFSFNSAGITGVSSSCTSAADIDKDGDVDLFIAGTDGTGTYHSILYLNNGSGVFSKKVDPFTDVYRGSADFGDVDEDGDLDLFVIGQDNSGNYTAILYENTGGGAFTPHDIGVTGLRDGSAVFFDMDSDGDLDLVVSGESESQGPFTSVYENNYY